MITRCFSISKSPLDNPKFKKQYKCSVNKLFDAKCSKPMQGSCSPFANVSNKSVIKTDAQASKTDL